MARVSLRAHNQSFPEIQRRVPARADVRENAAGSQDPVDVFDHLARCSNLLTTKELVADTLRRFAERVGISMDSVSRFERGRVPKDMAILMKLAFVADKKGLRPEANAFHEAAIEADRAERVDDIYRPLIPTSSVRSLGLSAVSPEAWRLMLAVRVAALYYPESVSTLKEAVGQAIGPALALVDAVLQDPQNRGLDYVALEYQINRLAETAGIVETAEAS
jgi:transcriptional regulator with XRE-family HTH domain